ncbi:hypothetical protein [Acidovorax sp. A79]|uniref:hypothetical protein n=1 Tax=Acidovorax sp. A79 TaxID=3056107 RepID=UPI0034E8AA37
MKKQRVMSAMVLKKTQNHKIAVRLSLVLVFFISFMSVYIFRALLDNDNATASGYLSATGAMLVACLSHS